MASVMTNMFGGRKQGIPRRYAPLSCIAFLILGLALPCAAEPPTVNYIFPAGGQRGTQVKVRIGGHYLHEKCNFAITGPGIQGPSEIARTETIWFEGPLIPQPASQRPEDYPKDYAATFTIAADAPLGSRPWRVWTSQGVTVARRFLIGELPEIVEQEIDGDPIPVPVKIPVTINGRTFPREDVDAWAFEATAGKPVTCAVVAQFFGSPLEARLELRDPHGTIVTEATPSGKTDPVLRFTPAVSGTYELRIHDVKFDGLQNYVYRLTITDQPWSEPVDPIALRAAQDEAASLKDFPAQAENEPNNTSEKAVSIPVPAVGAGVIDSPGDRDVWMFEAKKGTPIACEVQALKPDSPLQALLVLRDADGKELARRDALLYTNGEVLLNLNPPADGKYYAEVSERFASRGGPTFAYRFIASPPRPGVRLELLSETVSVDRGKQQKLTVNILRERGFNAPVKLCVEGLPPDVKAAEVTVPANRNRADLMLTAEETAKVSLHRVKVVGKYEVDKQPQTVIAVAPTTVDETTYDQVLVAVTMPTPFHFTAEFAMQFAAAGSVYRKRYVIDRGGYEGPLEVRLADRQGRHLQGVVGPTITVPADANEFVYPIQLAPWMELGRTSRVVPMLTGEVADEQGVKHKVCFTTNDQSCQLVSIVSPAPLRVLLDRPSIPVEPNSQVTLNVQLRRDKSLTSPVKLELALPPHVRDLRAEPVEVPHDKTEVPFTIHFGPSPGPFNMPLILRAVSQKDGDRLVAEATFDGVPIR